jgi:hypothetical protein
MKMQWREKVGKEGKAYKGKGEILNKTTKKSKVKLNKRGVAGNSEEQDRVGAVPCDL